MDDLKNMYKKVGICDAVILVTLVAILSIINYKYILPGVLGIVVALGNFVISGITTKDAVAKNNVNFFTYLSVMAKVFVTGLVGVVLISIDKNYIIPYLCGYISHFISLILYGQSLKNN